MKFFGINENIQPGIGEIFLGMERGFNRIPGISVPGQWEAPPDRSHRVFFITGRVRTVHTTRTLISFNSGFNVHCHALLNDGIGKGYWYAHSQNHF